MPWLRAAAIFLLAEKGEEVTAEFLVGVLITLAALSGMIAWAYHEVLRVDEVIESVDERLRGDKDQDGARQRELMDVHEKTTAQRSVN